jgi:ribose 5-phosphate isomerase A
LTGTTRLKYLAAQHAVNYLDSGMIIGLGHGSTALEALKLIAGKMHEGSLRNILCIPASSKVEKIAINMGLPLTSLNHYPGIDVTIDSADEVTSALNLIKGGGGALLREKIMARASSREIIIVDESKLSKVLGTKYPVPVEVVSFGWRYQVDFLENLGAKVKMRLSAEGSPFITDHGNLILDCNFGPIEEPAQLSAKINEQAGIVEHGLFINLADDLVIAGEKGIRHLRRREL